MCPEEKWISMYTKRKGSPFRNSPTLEIRSRSEIYTDNEFDIYKDQANSPITADYLFKQLEKIPRSTQTKNRWSNIFGHLSDSLGVYISKISFWSTDLPTNSTLGADLSHFHARRTGQGSRDGNGISDLTIDLRDLVALVELFSFIFERTEIFRFTRSDLT